jgi:ketosteroid isomerase-like protein
MRLPGLFPRVRKLLLALPAHSRIKKGIQQRVLSRAMEALSRGDYEVVLLTYSPDVEINVNGGAAVGFADHYRGHAGYREALGVWRAAWMGPRFSPEGLIDFGDRWVVRMRITGRGTISGADVAHTVGYVLDWADGLIVRMDVYWEWTECVSALGLDQPTRGASARQP